MTEPHRDHEGLFRALVEYSSDITVVLDEEGGVTYVSPSIERHLGFRPVEMVGRSLWTMIHPEDHERVALALRRRISEPAISQTTQFRTSHRNGSWHVVEAMGTNGLSDPRVRGLVISLRDVTERVRTEEALSESESRYRSIFAGMQEGLFLVERDAERTLRYVEANGALERITGVGVDGFVGRTPGEIFPVETATYLTTLYEKVLDHNDPETIEHTISLPRGMVTTRTRLIPLGSPGDRELRLMGISEDVTESRRAESALRESREALVLSEARFRSLMENSSDVILVLDADGEIVYESLSVQRILGYEPGEILGRPMFDFLHPDEMSGMVSSFDLSVRSPGVPVLGSCRFRHRDGSWRVVEGGSTNLVADPAVRGIVVNLRDSTERLAVEESNRRLAAVVAASDDGIISRTLDGTVLTWNTGAEQIFGFRAEEIIGQSCSILIPPDRGAEAADLLPRVERGEHIVNLETVRLGKDGAAVQVSLTLSPIHDEVGKVVAVSIVARDIGERLRVEAALRASNERYILAGRATNDVIWDWDLNADVIEWGDAICTGLGYSRDEVSADPHWWSKRIHPDDLQRVTKSLSEFLAGEETAWTAEYRFRRADGSYAHVLDRAHVLRDSRNIALRLTGSMSDRTAQMRAEEALVQAKEAAETASRSKSEFLSSMSHELRTPLNSVIGFTNVLRKNKGRNLRKQELAYLERIQANGMHLLGLINDILDLSKIEAGKMVLERTPVALDTLIRETLDELQGNVPSGVELVTAVPQPLGLIETDARKLKQVLINLVGNALKFTEAGSVQVNVEIDSGTRRPVRLEVKDTGVGIPPERLSAIFEAFEQGETGTARRFGGSGLGLAICSSLARLLGFRIEVESVVGAGSSFRIVLEPAPEVPGTHLVVSSGGYDRFEEPHGDLHDRVVLIIDDDPDARFVLSDAVAESGCEILTAHSGEHGLRLAREVRPDLITLDLLMPGLTGWETLSALKRDPQLQEVPVVVVSVVAEEQRGNILGAVDLLSKPVDRDQLQRTLRRNLGGARGGILIVDDQEDARLLMAYCLQQEGLEIRTAADRTRGAQGAPHVRTRCDLSRHPDARHGWDGVPGSTSGRGPASASSHCGGDRGGPRRR